MRQAPLLRGDPHEAEDLARCAFLRVSTRRQRVERRCALRGYLRRVSARLPDKQPQVVLLRFWATRPSTRGEGVCG